MGGAVDAVLRAASKGSRLTIVEIGHGEFSRALLRSLTDEAASGVEEIVVCSSSCDVEALTDGLPPVPMSAWKSPCRKVPVHVPQTGRQAGVSGAGLLLTPRACRASPRSSLHSDARCSRASACPRSCASTARRPHSRCAASSCTSRSRRACSCSLPSRQLWAGPRPRRCPAVWKFAAQRLRPIRPAARSCRRQSKLRAASGLGQPRPAFSLGQPRPASASLGQPRPAC